MIDEMIEKFARVDAESDVAFDYRASKKNQNHFRKWRVSRYFKNNQEAKVAYYQQYNKFYAQRKNIEIAKAKRMLDFYGFTVIERV